MIKVDVIKKEMERQGLSESKLAEMAGVTRMTVWNVLNETYKSPELKTAVAIASALNVPLTSIIDAKAA